MLSRIGRHAKDEEGPRVGLLAVNLAVALNVGVLSYLYPFAYGASLAPIWVRAADESVCIASLLVLMARPQTRRSLLRPSYGAAGWLALLFLSVFSLGAVMLATHAESRGNAYLLAKHLLLYWWVMPVLFAMPDHGRQRFIAVAGAIVVASGAVQIAFSLLLNRHWPTAALWRDDPFAGYSPIVGFIINPNRFGLVLNLALAFLLAYVAMVASRPRALAGALGAIAVVGALPLAASLSQLLVCLGLLLYAAGTSAYFSRRAFLRLLAVAFAGIVVILLFPGPLDPKVNDLVGQVVDLIRGSERQEYSDSIGGRLADFRALVAYIDRNDIVTLIFGGMIRQTSIHAHGDFWLILYQLGLIGLLALASALFGALRASFSAQTLQIHWGLTVFAATFLVDNAIEEFPTGFLFLLVLTLGLAQRRTQPRTGGILSVRPARAALRGEF